jgi:hypothetical protein
MSISISKYTTKLAILYWELDLPTSHPRCRQLCKIRLEIKYKSYKPLTMAQGGSKPSYFVPKGVGNEIAKLTLKQF